MSLNFKWCGWITWWMKLRPANCNEKFRKLFPDGKLKALFHPLMVLYRAWGDALEIKVCIELIPCLFYKPITFSIYFIIVSLYNSRTKYRRKKSKCRCIRHLKIWKWTKWPGWVPIIIQCPFLRAFQHVNWILFPQTCRDQ